MNEPNSDISNNDIENNNIYISFLRNSNSLDSKLGEDLNFIWKLNHEESSRINFTKKLGLNIYDYVKLQFDQIFF